MKPTVPNRIPMSRHPRCNRTSAAAITVLAIANLIPLSVNAESMEEASASTPPALTHAAQELRSAYRQQQWQRLAMKNDRDNLIAAVLLGMPTDDDRAPITGHADVEQRLARGFGRDPLALFTLALACQMQDSPCVVADAHDALTRVAPDNAVHWLLLPNDAAPSDAQLHSAAMAKYADAHLRDTTRILLAALADQPAPAQRAGIDPHELALRMRRDAIDQVALPKFRAAVVVCKGADGQRRDDCIALGRNLEADRSGTILSKMIGVAIVRRLLKGTPDDAAAKELRRDYVWMGEQLDASKQPFMERLRNETVAYGEWRAGQRAVERMGATATPPPGWIPKNPQTLLLSEERTPPSSK
ncbi:MAG TPA: hypothetical protein VGT79_07280 [Xanthomonadaceae bacterium]|nr:hypothetical protein [Xanthomonadaceae bacterium]